MAVAERNGDGVGKLEESDGWNFSALRSDLVDLQRQAEPELPSLPVCRPDACEAPIETGDFPAQCLEARDQTLLGLAQLRIPRRGDPVLRQAGPKLGAEGPRIGIIQTLYSRIASLLPLFAARV